MNNYMDETISNLIDLVRIPTFSDEGEVIKCADAILELLEQKIGFKTRKFTLADYPLIYAEKIVSNEKKTLVFYNHYDVKPVEALNEWDSPPFEPEVREGKLYGRGVSDNKGNIIARIFAIKAYQDIFGELPLNVKFIIEGTEEIGSPSFLKFMKNYPDLTQGDFCIWEYGARNAKGYPQVKLGGKGLLSLNVEIKGATRQLHSLWGHLVENPAWDLVWLLNTLKDKAQTILIEGFYDNVQSPTKKELTLLDTIPFMEETYTKDFGIQQFMRKGKELKEAFYFLPSLTINGLVSGYQGPRSQPIIPKIAEASLDFWLVPNQDPIEIMEKVRMHLQKLGLHNVKITFIRSYSPARTPITSEYLKLICETGEKIYNQPLIIQPLVGLRPMDYFRWNTSNPTLRLQRMYLLIPQMDCFTLGCGYENDQIHAPNENINIQDLLLHIKHLAAIFHSFTKK